MQENPNMEDYLKDGFKIMVEATKHSNSLPTGRDWAYYVVHDSFKNFMNEESDRILRLMNTIIHKQEIEENIRNRDLHEKTELIVEANDTVLERVANNIDELNGIRKKPLEDIEIQTVSAQLPVNGSWNRLSKATFSVNSSPTVSLQSHLKSITLLTAKNIIKPQKFFKDKIDNTNDHPWIPRISEKPNSLKPLAIFLEETELGPAYSHPYEFELEKFKPSPEQLKRAQPVFPKELEITPFHEINTPEALNDLLEELRKYDEIAVDLEHHSYRSFMGITCLMQISTSEADYIIDTLALRDKLYILNEVFTKPTVVKIFHGAISDIEWLQRDLSLYVVNMFDTHIAAKQLQYSGLSLSYLMTRFCKIKPNKHFQLADWRIRPLPDELKTYARMDTHYLIYIYHMMKNELLDKAHGKDNILISVIQKSTELCMRRYMKPILKDDSHLDFYRKCKRIFDNRQMYALKELYRWRDSVAREEDESTGYVLPNHMLLQISEALPREMQGILACCNPIPTLVRANLLELHQFILKAREQPLIKPILKEGNRSRGSTLQIFKVNIESPLHCPHDMSKQQEFRDDLPTLLHDKSSDTRNDADDDDDSNIAIIDQKVNIEKEKSILSIFDSENTQEEVNRKKIMHNKVKKLKFLGPFERYKLLKPYIAAEEAKEAEKKNENKNDENRSDEERIAAIHEHFKTVSKLVPQKVPEEQAKDSTDSTDVPVIDLVTETVTDLVTKTIPGGRTLASMGGIKRKRETCDVIEIVDESCKQFENSITTPVPKIKKGRYINMFDKKQSRKRKRKQFNNLDDFPGQNQQTTNANQPPAKKSKKAKQQRPKGSLKKFKGTNQLPFQQQERFNEGNDAQTVSNEIKRKNKKRWFHSNKQNKRKQWNENNPNLRHNEGNRYVENVQNDQRQAEGNFKPFDYSSVDYTQFRSGGRRPANQNKIKSKFRGKGKNRKKGNAQNKSMTFTSGKQGNATKARM